MQKITLYAAAMAATLLLSGCGGDSKSDSTSNTTVTPGGVETDGGGSNNDNSLSSVINGKLVYDYALRKLGGSYHLYRLDLSTSEQVEFARDEYTATHLLVGGEYTNDLYSPAVVSASENHIRISSRIDGTTTTFPHPRASDPNEAVPCEIEAVTNTNGDIGLIAVEMAESVEACLNWNSELVDNWIYHYTPEGGKWWKADGSSRLRDIFFTASGEIDFVIARNRRLGTTTVYSVDGSVERDFEGDGQPNEIISLDDGGLTRDDTFVAVLIDDKVQVVSRRLLIESGLIGAQTILSGLSGFSEVVTWMHRSQSGDIIISDANDLYLVDGIQRSGRKIANLVSYLQDGWYVDEAFVRNGMVYVVIEKNVGDWETGYKPIGALLSIELSNDSLALKNLVQSEERIKVEFGTETLFFNYVTAAGMHEAVIVDANGEKTVSEGHHYYGSAWNLEKGGELIETFVIKSGEGNVDEGMTNPSLWSVNPATGSDQALVGNIDGTCKFVDGFYSIGEHATVYSFCDGDYAFQSLNLNTGSLEWISSGLHSIR